MNLRRIRKSKTAKALAALCSLSMLTQTLAPTTAWALTSGPAQPEYGGFEQIGTTDMVDLSTGDFSYNIPLMTVPGPNGGYPLNLAYKSGIGMEQEASWVGLGWSLNVGSVNRQLQGLPDDFNGDKVEHTMHQRPSTNITLDLPVDVLGGQKGEAGWLELTPRSSCTVYYNTTKGLGYRISGSVTPSELDDVDEIGVQLGLTLDSQNGVGLSASLSG